MAVSENATVSNTAQASLLLCKFEEKLNFWVLFWELLRLTKSVLFINMGYLSSIDVVYFINNVLFKINPPCDKNKPYVKYNLIFSYCILIKDIFSFGGALRKELLYKRSYVDVQSQGKKWSRKWVWKWSGKWVFVTGRKNKKIHNFWHQ